MDVIILCTGYLHHFPFLSNELKLVTKNRLYPDMLYNGVVHYNNPKLYFIGMQDQKLTFNMFDTQSWQIRDIIMGKINLPSKEEMLRDIQVWQAKEDNLETFEESTKFQVGYVQHLLKLSDLDTFDVDAMGRVLMDFKCNKNEEIMTFRDKSHKSTITNTIGTIHTKTWMDEVDDSLRNWV